MILCKTADRLRRTTKNLARRRLRRISGNAGRTARTLHRGQSGRVQKRPSGVRRLSAARTHELGAGRTSRPGLRVVSGGTDNHLVPRTSRRSASRARKPSPHSKRSISSSTKHDPVRPKTARPSGIRLGTPAITTWSDETRPRSRPTDRSRHSRPRRRRAAAAIAAQVKNS